MTVTQKSIILQERRKTNVFLYIKYDRTYAANAAINVFVWIYCFKLRMNYHIVRCFFEIKFETVILLCFGVVLLFTFLWEMQWQNTVYIDFLLFLYLLAIKSVVFLKCVYNYIYTKFNCQYCKLSKYNLLVGLFPYLSQNRIVATCLCPFPFHT